MLNLDLLSLETPAHFEMFCTRLVRKEFAYAMPTATTWDGGKDIYLYVPEPGKPDRQVVWQTKFLRRLDSSARAKIASSLRVLARSGQSISQWILCVPIDPTEKFLSWLRDQPRPPGCRLEVWGRKVLLEKLENHPDILQTFFYRVYDDLRRVFRTPKIELYDIHLDPDCGWRESDGVLRFRMKKYLQDPDLVLDITLRNLGTVETALTGIAIDVINYEHKPHGIPGEGLLFPQVTYRISIGAGQFERVSTRCEPPLIVRAAGLERFQLCLTETGFAWRGTAVITLSFGADEDMHLPAFDIFA